MKHLFLLGLFTFLQLWDVQAQVGEHHLDQIDVRPMWFTTMLVRYYECIDRGILSDFQQALDSKSGTSWPDHYDVDYQNWKLDDENLILREKIIYRYDRFEGSGERYERYSWDNQVEFEIEFDLKTGNLTVHYEADENELGFVEGEQTFSLGQLPRFVWYQASSRDGSRLQQERENIRNAFIKPTLRLGSTYPVSWWRRPGGLTPLHNHEGNLLTVDRREWSQCLTKDYADDIPEDLFQAPEGNPFDFDIQGHINDRIRNSVYDMPDISAPLNTPRASSQTR